MNNTTARTTFINICEKKWGGGGSQTLSKLLWFEKCAWFNTQHKRLTALLFNNSNVTLIESKFLVRLHGEYNILVKLCGNTTYIYYCRAFGPYARIFISAIIIWLFQFTRPFLVQSFFETLQYCDEWRKFTSVSQSVSESVSQSVSQS